MSPGYFACDGSILSQAAYPSLFSAIGTAYNIGGEGAGNFRIPDKRGRTPVGAGNGPGLSGRSLGQQVGEENHTLSTAELASHGHGVSDGGHGHSISGTAFNNQDIGFPRLSVGGGNALYGGGFPNINADGSGANISIQATGSGSGHNNMQPSLVCNILIKY